MNADLNEIVRRFIEGELDPDSERAALHAIAEDDAARDLLRLEYDLRGFFFENPGGGIVPVDFTDRVMTIIAPEPEKRPVADRIRSWLANIRRSLFTPHMLVWRPAYVLVVSLLLILAGLMGGKLFDNASVESSLLGETSVRQVSMTASGEVLMRFVFVESDASSVSVAGDFTEWEPIALSSQEVDGQIVWTGTLPVARGEHRYMFVIDEETWVSDPLAPVQRDDGFGNKNAVLVL